MRHLIPMALLLAAPHIATAEIFREARPCESKNEMCFFWWPKLPTVTGWKQDEESSYHYSINALSPTDSTFNDSKTVMYAKAAYKQRLPKFQSLDEFIAFDQKSFLTSTPELTISKEGDSLTASGIPLQIYLFKPKGEGSWDLVAYGKEKDSDGNEYYLTFAISSRDEAGIRSATPTFKTMIAAYK